MDNQKRIAMALIAVGLVIGLVGILADVIGLGSDTEHFGDRQILVTVVGIVILLAGVAFHYYGDRFMGSKPTKEEVGEAEQ